MKEIFDNAVTLYRNLLEHKKYGHLIKFSITGGINTIVDFSIFSIMAYLNIHYVVCQTAGYSMGMLNSYFLNKFWTFNDQKNNKKTSSEIMKFIIVNGTSFLLTLLALRIFKDNLGINIYLAKVFTIVIAQAVNFLGYKLWVFKVAE
jgi:putative flippase GtrA